MSEGRLKGEVALNYQAGGVLSCLVSQLLMLSHEHRCWIAGKAESR